jgi:hypothetical protein
LGGFIGSTNNGNHYAKTAPDDGRKSNRKKTQTGEEERRVFSESFEENPREEDPIPDRQFCIRSISTVACRCSADQPINRSRSWHFQAAAPNTSQAKEAMHNNMDN